MALEGGLQATTARGVLLLDGFGAVGRGSA
jgi:hypothetical protein